MATENENQGNGNKPKTNSVMLYLNAKGEKLIAAVPKSFQAALTLESIIQAVGLMLEDPKNGAKLKACTPESFYFAMLTGLRLGLDPAPSRQQFFVVAYETPRDSGRYVANFQAGYRGLLTLARRSGEVGKINAQPVYESDEIELDLSSGEVHHKINGDDLKRIAAEGRGQLLASYCQIWLKGEENPTLELATRDDLAKARKNTPSWDEWPDRMAKKFVLKRALNYVPNSPDLARALKDDVDFEERDNPAARPSAMPDDTVGRRNALDASEVGRSNQLPDHGEPEDTEAELARLREREAQRVRAQSNGQSNGNGHAGKPPPPGDDNPPFRGGDDSDDDGGMP